MTSSLLGMPETVTEPVESMLPVRTVFVPELLYETQRTDPVVVVVALATEISPIPLLAFGSGSERLEAVLLTLKLRLLDPGVAAVEESPGTPLH